MRMSDLQGQGRGKEAKADGEQGKEGSNARTQEGCHLHGDPIQQGKGGKEVEQQEDAARKFCLAPEAGAGLQVWRPRRLMEEEETEEIKQIAVCSRVIIESHTRALTCVLRLCSFRAAGVCQP